MSQNKPFSYVKYCVEFENHNAKCNKEMSNFLVTP